MPIVNCTPHELTIISTNCSCVHGRITDEEGFEDFCSHRHELILPKCQTAIRVSISSKLVGLFEGVEEYETVLGEVIDLPKEKKGTLLVVSRIVKDASPGREDLRIPGNLFRDKNGKVIGCYGLSK